MYCYTGTSVLKIFSLKQYDHYFFLNHGKRLAVEMVIAILLEIYNRSQLVFTNCGTWCPRVLSIFFSGWHSLGVCGGGYCLQTTPVKPDMWPQEYLCNSLQAVASEVRSTLNLLTWVSLRKVRCHMRSCKNNSSLKADCHQRQHRRAEKSSISQMQLGELKSCQST